MSFSDLPAAVVTAWAQLVSAIATPFVAIFLFILGRDVKRVKEQTDGMSKDMAAMSEAKGHSKGVAQARAEGEEKAATLAEGQAQGRAEGRAPLNHRDQP